MQDLLEPILKSPRMGDYYERLTRAIEAERARRAEFYALVHENVNAEFINGEILWNSPAKFRHGDCSLRLAHLLRTHAELSRLGKVGHEKLMVSLSRNDYEPDISFWRQEVAKEFAPDQMHFPAPDFIAEVLSDSTEAVDRGIKFEDYAAHGVAEYWIIDPGQEVVEQYFNTGSRFELHLKLNSGDLSSRAVPGFKIPVRAIFDDAEHLRASQLLLSTPEPSKTP